MLAAARSALAGARQGFQALLAYYGDAAAGAGADAELLTALGGFVQLFSAAQKRILQQAEVGRLQGFEPQVSVRDQTELETTCQDNEATHAYLAELGLCGVGFRG